MSVQQCKLTIVVLGLLSVGVVVLAPGSFATSGESALDDQLVAVLEEHGFTGRIGSTLERRLGRKIDHQLAQLGRLAFHDSLLGLNDDNSCSGCHAAANGFGDSQSIAIGIENNNVVGPDRTGPRNQRRTPMLLNNVFYRSLMWNSRFAAVSGDPFDNTGGFEFPAPESFTLSFLPHLLTAQAFIPVTENVEMAGFAETVPGTHDGVRDVVAQRLNANAEYRNARQVHCGIRVHACLR
jgi:cytochrome c peroxidase